MIQVTPLKGSMVGRFRHTAFTIAENGAQVGSGLNVDTPDGRRLIRVFNHDPESESELRAHMLSLANVSEVTFSNPFLG